MKKIPGANSASWVRPSARAERVIWYTCHATATDCASAPRITSSRAAWYSRQSRDRNAPPAPASATPFGLSVISPIVSYSPPRSQTLSAPTADTPQSPRRPSRAPAPAPPLRPKSYPAAMFPRLTAAPREHAATPHRHSQSRLARPAPPRTTSKAQSHAPGRAIRSPASPAETARTAPPQSPPPSTPARCAATPARFFRPQSKLADRLPDCTPCLQDDISAARSPGERSWLAGVERSGGNL